MEPNEIAEMFAVVERRLNDLQSYCDRLDQDRGKISLDLTDAENAIESLREALANAVGRISDLERR